MKFSFALIKKLVPQVKSKKELIEKLNLYSFEAEDGEADTFEVSLPPNRFSDAASHWGMAKEISAILGKKFECPKSSLGLGLGVHDKSRNSRVDNFRVMIRDKNLCSRYAAAYFDNVKVVSSPSWMQKILVDCGLRPINNIVDIMNYAMLETGQPLHAFDYDKLLQDESGPEIIVRLGEKGEKISALDDKVYELDGLVLVIADSRRPLSIAGIKGGQNSQIDKNTKRIIVEAANFNGVNIYRSSRFLNLRTDASLRFSHNLNPELAEIGLSRAGELLREIVGARPGKIIDLNFARPQKKIIKLSLERLKSFIGIDLDFKKAKRCLELLGFRVKVPARALSRYPADEFLVEVPALREDVLTFEDIAEELARYTGYNSLKSQAPKIHLAPSGFEDQIILKDKTKKILTRAGLSEVYNYSFISKEEGRKFARAKKLIPLQNPVSNEYYYLRPSLISGLLRNAEDNLRFFESVKVFEIGKVFSENPGGAKERLVLGLILASKSKEPFFELKGLLAEFLKSLGLVDFWTAPFSSQDNWFNDSPRHYLETNTLLKVESDNNPFGYLGKIKQATIKRESAFAEIDLDILLQLISGEYEYQPLPRYPAVERDISLVVEENVRISDIISQIQDVSRTIIQDVDLIDEYERSLTFRIVFQAEDRTLTDKEVNDQMKKITDTLRFKFKARIR
ncbi:phenylalanine--tRNA ligase subunit beta [Candidatus Wolfebacteria bacterium]|nr:phenylalanine--tRNA ligase subunit beta [Candidatus Wolfebacteria bacterium]